MTPQVGQRWIFSWNNSDCFLAEVIEHVSPRIWKWKILQIFENDPNHRVGDVFNNALSECWRYLEGQDRSKL